MLPFFGPYTATKFAVEALAQTSSFELAHIGVDTTIVQPGAFGTTFMEHSMMAKEGEVIGQYGALPEVFKAFSGAFEERAKAGKLGDPKEVVDALVEVTEAPKGSLPARRPVGKDVAEPVSAINKLNNRIHEGLFKAFGLK